MDIGSTGMLCIGVWLGACLGALGIGMVMESRIAHLEALLRAHKAPLLGVLTGSREPS